MRAARFLLPVLLLPGCVTVAPTLDAVPAPSAVPSPSPSPSPSPVASPSPPTPPPSTPSPLEYKTTTVSGMVYDEAGNPVDGATVTISSLEATIPYRAATTTHAGAWTITTVPEGSNVEIVASKPGWTSRRRVGSLQTQPVEGYHVSFGGGGTLSNGYADPGLPYFLSRYPEVAATEPAPLGDPVDPSSLRYKLKLSHPLDDANRRRFEDALRLGPGMADFRPGQEQPPTIRKGTAFGGATATVGWNAAGDEATLAFDAPLLASNEEPKRYQAFLVSGGEPIVDTDGYPLGRDAAGAWTPPPAGNLVRGAFHLLDPSSVASQDGDRWSRAHGDVAGFKVRQDTTIPKLTGASLAKDGKDGHIILTFDEPMIAFGGAPGLVGAERLAGLTFVLGEGPPPDGFAYRDDIELLPRQLDDPAFRLPSGREFRFEASINTTGRVTLALDPRNPKQVDVTLVGRADLLTGPLAVYAAGLADPAGNVIPSAEAARHVVTGTL